MSISKHPVNPWRGSPDGYELPAVDARAEPQGLTSCIFMSHTNESKQ